LIERGAVSLFDYFAAFASRLASEVGIGRKAAFPIVFMWTTMRFRNAPRSL
jgi:hypothetical protein